MIKLLERFEHKMWILYLIFIVTYLLGEFFSIKFLVYAYAFILLLLVLQAFPKAKYSTRIISVFLFGAGIIALVFGGVDTRGWITAFTANGGLVAFFLSLPLFSVALTYKDYRESINALFVKRVQSKSGFLILVSWLTLLISTILNIATDYMLDNLLRRNAERYEVKHGFYQALVRGNMAAVLWAPNYIAVATVITCTGLDWLEIAPSGFLLSVVYMLLVNIAFFVLHRDRKDTTRVLPEVLEDMEEKGTKEQEKSSDVRQVITASEGSLRHLFFVLLGLILFVVMFNASFALSFLAVIIITAAIYPLLLAVVFQKLDVYRKQTLWFFKVKLPSIKDEVILFAAIGFFGKVLDMTGVGNMLFSYIPLDKIPFVWLTVFTVIVIMGIISLVGIHPIVSVSVLSSILTPAALGLSPVAFAQMLLLGYIVAATSSPFTAISLLMAGISGESSWNVVPRLNIGFNLIVVVVFSFLLPML